MHTIMLLAFICYFFILAGISLFVKKAQETEASFLLGNRSVNYWVTAIATQASDMGGWLFLAFPAAVYTHGLFEYWTVIGLVSFTFLNWHFIAARLRQETEAYQAVTLTGYFSKKYRDSSRILGLVGGFIILFFFTFYIASGLIAMGTLFEAAFAINYHIGICIALLTVVLYTLIGGFVAVAWCDFFQGIFLLGVIVLMPLYTLYILGSTEPIMASAQLNAVSLSLFPADKSVFSALFLAASWGLGYFGQPHILVNFMGIDNPEHIKRATAVGITWQVIALTASTCIGLVGLGFYPDGLANSELLFVSLTQALCTPLLAGFALCAVLAATLSTMDSNILVSGAAYTEDILPFFTQAHPSRAVFNSRVGSILVSLSALFIAWHSHSSVYQMVNYAWSGFGSSFGPLLLLSLYTNKVTKQGALAGIIVGSLVSGILPFMHCSLLPLVPGFFASMLAIILVSQMGK